jgi:3'-phosphoadenosine 5'-phosphosulfate sulfotransferase (PAPS reductase)/FAD synthetase
VSQRVSASKEEGEGSENMNGKVRILCLGAGVNSTALLVLHQKDVVKFDIAVFADTGGEHPETYAYLENVIKPLC